MNIEDNFISDINPYTLRDYGYRQKKEREDNIFNIPKTDGKISFDICCQNLLKVPYAPANSTISKLWDQKSTITISFFGGDEEKIKKVKNGFTEYQKHVNLVFNYTQDNDKNAIIRIGFENKGSYSFIGTDNRFIHSNVKTMNIWLTSNEKEDEATILHEIGHMVGLNHEHQRIDTPIKWNIEKLREYYKQKYGWDQELVYNNIVLPMSSEITNNTIYDPKSIMHYWFPEELIDLKLEKNYALSDNDIQLLKSLYPKIEGSDKFLNERFMSLEKDIKVLKMSYALLAKIAGKLEINVSEDATDDIVPESFMLNEVNNADKNNSINNDKNSKEKEDRRKM